MNNTVNVIDSIMGSGKTSWAIDKMLNDNTNNYIYITPYLSEVERIKEHCKDKRFTEPKQLGHGKLDSLHKLIINNRNIASTHALFRMATKTTIELLKANNYILILDEVMDVVEQIHLKKNDMDVLKTMELITIDENNMVHWNNDKQDFDSKYNDIKTMCDSNSVFMVNNCLLMWTFPIEVFKSFKEVYILTYLFKGQIQRYYYDLYKLPYKYQSVTKQDDKYILCDYIETYDMTEIREKINVLKGHKINNIGFDKYALSKTWYDKAEPEVLKQLQNNIQNYFRNIVNGKSQDNIWCTFKDYKKVLSGKGYTKGFVSVGTRATNDYADTYNLAYCVNIFLNPIVKSFFDMHNVKICEDTYALSEMLQWLWRSRIRKGESINIYLPSSRMHLLLAKWLKEREID